MKSYFKKHYHWVIAIIVLIQLMICGGINNNLSSLFMIPVTETLGITRGTFSTAMSLKSISSFLASGFSGAILLRFGYRKSVLACLLLAVIGLGTLSASSDIVMFALGGIILGLADGICIFAGPPRVISMWFHRHQGMVLGLVTAATGLGGSLVCLLLSAIIEGAGWDKAYLCGCILVIAVAVMMFLLFRNRPSDIGLKPYGEGEIELKKKPRKDNDHWVGYTMKEMMRAPVFYLMCIGTFVSCVCSTLSLNVLVPHLQDCGLSVQEATAMQSMLMLVLAAVKFGCGSLSDMIGARWVTMICLAGTAVSLVLFTVITGPISAFIAVAVYSLSLPLTSTMIPLLSSALFGYQSQAGCVGIFFAMASVSGMITAPVTNAIYDRIGTYEPIFLVGAVIAVCLMGMYLLMYKLAGRDKKQILAIHAEESKA